MSEFNHTTFIAEARSLLTIDIQAAADFMLVNEERYETEEVNARREFYALLVTTLGRCDRLDVALSAAERSVRSEEARPMREPYKARVFINLYGVLAATGSTGRAVAGLQDLVAGGLVDGLDFTEIDRAATMLLALTGVDLVAEELIGGEGVGQSASITSGVVQGLMERGRFDDAVAIASQSWERTRDAVSPRTRALLASNISIAMRAAGRAAGAHKYLDEAREVVWNLGPNDFVGAHFLLSEALILATVGRGREALLVIESCRLRFAGALRQHNDIRIALDGLESTLR